LFVVVAQVKVRRSLPLDRSDESTLSSRRRGGYSGYSGGTNKLSQRRRGLAGATRMMAPKAPAPTAAAPTAAAPAPTTTGGGKAGKSMKGVSAYLTPRAQVIGVHTKWSLCTSKYYVGEGSCDTQQPFVPRGFYFETGRRLPEGTVCSALTGVADVPVVTCQLVQGVTLVLPVVSQSYYGCDEQGKVEDGRIGPAKLMKEVCNYEVLKATLDGAPVSAKDSVRVVTQDGDGTNLLSFGGTPCTDYFGDFVQFANCPLFAAGEYVFVDTAGLSLGNHSLVLIGQDNSDGFCSAVRFDFVLVAGKIK
jgi:hypothetical protein